jgi:1-deoxy-D-xylulose-5-phosphate synthase
VADARFAKPLDVELVERLARQHELVVTVEEASLGGFGAAVLQHLAGRGLLDGRVKLRTMTLPDRFIDHDTQSKQLAAAGLDANAIVATVLAALGKDISTFKAAVG